jgi:hypothetical protein
VSGIAFWQLQQIMIKKLSWSGPTYGQCESNACAP